MPGDTFLAPKRNRFVGSYMIKEYDGRVAVLHVPVEFAFLIYPPVTKDRWGEQRIDIPDGFVTDFASTPRWSWWLFPPAGDGPKADYKDAAVIHDKLYQDGMIGQTPISKNTADQVFLYALRARHVAPWRRAIMYRAVRHSRQSRNAWNRERSLECR